MGGPGGILGVGLGSGARTGVDRVGVLRLMASTEISGSVPCLGRSPEMGREAGAEGTVTPTTAAPAVLRFEGAGTGGVAGGGSASS
jgi:hypothetical protein